MADPKLKPLLTATQLAAVRTLLKNAPSDGQGLCLIRGDYLAGLLHDAEVASRLDALSIHREITS